MRSTKPSLDGHEKQALVLELFRVNDPGTELAAQNRSEGQTMANLVKSGMLTRRRVGKTWYYRLRHDELPLR